MGEGRDVLDALTYSGKRALGESQSKDASVPVTAARRRFFALSATSTVTVAVRGHSYCCCGCRFVGGRG